jgi:hypothetical protein
MASLCNLISLLPLIAILIMGVVRLELMILQKMIHRQVGFRIFNEQMILKRSIILYQLDLKANFLPFAKFMNYSG